MSVLFSKLWSQNYGALKLVLYQDTIEHQNQILKKKWKWIKLDHRWSSRSTSLTWLEGRGEIRKLNSMESDSIGSNNNNKEIILCVEFDELGSIPRLLKRTVHTKERN